MAGKLILRDLSEAVAKFKMYIDDQYLAETVDSEIARYTPSERFDFGHFCAFLANDFPRSYEPYVARFIADIYDLEIMTDENKIMEEVSFEDLNRYSILKARNDLCIHLTNNRILVTHPTSKVIGSRKPVLSYRSVILKVLNEIDASRKREALEVGRELRTVQKVEDIFNDIIQKAIVYRTSDIHIEYNEFLRASVIRFRRDGMLVSYAVVPDPDLGWHTRLANHIMVRSELNAGEFFKLHDAQIDIEVAKRPLSLRVSIVPTYVSGQGRTPVPQICLRLMASEEIGVESDLVKLGFSPEVSSKLRRIVYTPNGMFLVCGPTGSGKNTTLYALLDIVIRNLPVKVISIEDPVEKKLKVDARAKASVVQIEVTASGKSGGGGAGRVTFADALRAVLRHDPDVVFVGEIRDQETAEEAVKAGVTGHLVFSTLHTNSSFDVIPRLTQTLKVHPTLVESVMRGVLSQRLIRKLCPDCARYIKFGELIDFIQSSEQGEFRSKVSYEVSYLKQTYFSGKEEYSGIFNEDDTIGLPIGCSKCNGVGFIRRTVLWDLLVFTPANKERLFHKNEGEVSLYLDPQCEPMALVGIDLVKKRVTSLDEVERFVDVPSFLEMYYKVQLKEGLWSSRAFSNEEIRCLDLVEGHKGLLSTSVVEHQVNENSIRINNLSKEFNDLKNSLTTQVARVNDVISSIRDEGYNNLSDRISRIESDLSNISSRIASLTMSVESGSRKEDLSKYIEEIKRSVVEEAGSFIRDKMQEISKRIEQIASSRAALDSYDLDKLIGDKVESAVAKHMIAISTGAGSNSGTLDSGVIEEKISLVKNEIMNDVSRFLAGKLEEIVRNIEQIRSVSSSVSNISDFQEMIKNEIKAFWDSYTSTGNDLQVEVLEEQLTNRVASRLKGEVVDEVNAQIAFFKNEMTDRISSITEDFNRKLDSSMSLFLQGKLSEVADSIANIINEIKSQVDKLNSSIQDIHSQIGAQEGKYAAKAEVARLLSVIDTMGSTVKNFEMELKAISSKLNGYEEVTNSIANVRDELYTLLSKEVERNISSVNTYIDARLSKIEAENASLKQSMQQSVESVSRYETVLQNLIRQEQDRVTLYQMFSEEQEKLKERLDRLMGLEDEIADIRGIIESMDDDIQKLRKKVMRLSSQPLTSSVGRERVSQSVGDRVAEVPVMEKSISESRHQKDSLLSRIMSEKVDFQEPETVNDLFKLAKELVAYSVPSGIPSDVVEELEKRRSALSSCYDEIKGHFIKIGSSDYLCMAPTELQIRFIRVYKEFFMFKEALERVLSSDR